jgi:hypothetical protein
MTRALLLRTLSAAALSACAAHGAYASSIINGGGATSPQGDYAGPNNPNTGAPLSEFSTYNQAQTAVQFGTYWGSGATGQTAFLNDDLTCDINKVTGNNGGACSNTPGGANTVHYNASDSVLTSTQISGWATSTYGQALSGNLIQIPMLGTAQSIIVNDTNITQNGQLTLSDADLCGIFSGKITDFSAITDSKIKPAAGPITLVYRNDTAAATYILTNHLAAVCTASNSNITFVATTSFSSLFPNGNVTGTIPLAVGQKGAAGVANYMAGLSSGPVPQAVGYDSPDWTSVAPASDSLLSNGLPSPLLVAAVTVGKKSYVPTTANITLGLSHVVIGNTLTPPTNATQGANPANWVPVIQTVSAGYPIIAYGSFELPQCFSDPLISKAWLAYLKLHYTNSSYTKIQSNNGLVRIANSGASKFLAAVQKNIIANANKWGTDIGDKTACTGLAGR